MPEPDRLAGETIDCPHCFETVLIITQDIQNGETIKSGQFVGANGYPDPVVGEPADCPNCGYNLIFGGAFS